MQRPLLAHVALIGIAFATHARAAVTVSWSWDGLTDPGFIEHDPDATTFYDAANHVMKMGYGARAGVPACPSGTTLVSKQLPFAFADATLVVEYSLSPLGYFIDPTLANSDAWDPLTPAVSRVGAHVYDGPAGTLTYLYGYCDGSQILHDQFMSTSDPQATVRYRLTTSRIGADISGKLEKLQGSSWIVLGTKGPFSVPCLNEPLDVIRFDTAASNGTYGQAAIYSISVTGTLAPTCPADSDHNGVVDETDLGLLLSDWGICP
ncbi:MAG: hypothetical protein U1D55_10970 [Phycisphaerae bacterium]